MATKKPLVGTARIALDDAASFPPIPPNLLVHLRDRRLVLFAGAGLSAQAGLPTWRSLIQEVVTATVAEAMQGDEVEAELRAMLEGGKWLQLADHCKEKLGPGGYTRLLAERLSDSGRPIPLVHRLAVQLPFAAWVTTNYDKLLERAYAEERGGLPKTLTNADTEPLGRLLFDAAPFVLKAHGDLDKPESLVLTSRDYRDLIHGNTAFNAAFSAILLTHSVLFVGYSLSDPDFNLLLDRQLLTFRGFVPERYALMSGIGKVEQEYLWRVCRIRVIPYPEGRHEAMPNFFQRLTIELAEKRMLVGGPGEPPGTSAAAAPRSPERAPVPIEAGTAPIVLAINWRENAVDVTLRDREQLIESTLSPAAAWSDLVSASRNLGSKGLGDGSHTSYGAQLTDSIGAPLVARLARMIKEDPKRSFRLELSRQTERVPWELLRIGEQALAEAAPVYRAPVGVSEDARGLPAIRSPARALVIADTTSSGGTGPFPVSPLPGAAEEAREVAAAIERNNVGTVRLLLGAAATAAAVARAFDELEPDIVHFAGHAWFDAHEAFLALSDSLLTASILRPWLTRHPPALMFLNSHFTAFIPAGLDAAQEMQKAEAVQGGLGGRAGFSDVAMRSGVGSFVGAFSGAIDDKGAKDFALSFYDALLAGATVAEAVHAARRDRTGEINDTPLLFCTYGAGNMRLVAPRTVASPRRKRAKP